MIYKAKQSGCIPAAERAAFLTFPMSSLSNTGCLGRVGGEGIRVLSSGSSGSRVTKPGEENEDWINVVCFKGADDLWDVADGRREKEIHTLSPERLVGFTDLCFIGKGHRPAVQHLYNLQLDFLWRSVAHVLETRGSDQEAGRAAGHSTSLLHININTLCGHGSPLETQL